MSQANDAPCLVHWKPSAPGQYQANPATMEPSTFTPQASPQLPSRTQSSAGWPRSTQPVACCHLAGFELPSAPVRPLTIVLPSAEIPMEELNVSPNPRSTNPPEDVQRKISPPILASSLCHYSREHSSTSSGSDSLVAQTSLAPTSTERSKRKHTTQPQRAPFHDGNPPECPAAIAGEVSWPIELAERPGRNAD